MSVHSLTPWKRKSGLEASGGANPLRSLQSEVDSIFDNFFRGFSFAPAIVDEGGILAPKLDVAETEKEYQVTLEIPGVEEKDIDVSLSGDVLTIKGEKKAEEKEEGKNWHRVERSYGSFQRSFTLPDGVNSDKIEAGFKNGVLDVRIPKTGEVKLETKKISVKKS